MKYIKTYEEKRRGQEVVYTFKTKAKTNSGHEYTIHLLEGGSNYDETNGYSYNGLCISIDTTPGCWYVATFLHYNPDSSSSNIISISGNDWICVNRQEIVKELKFWLENEYPFWKDTNKYNL